MNKLNLATSCFFYRLEGQVSHHQVNYLNKIKGLEDYLNNLSRDGTWDDANILLSTSVMHNRPVTLNYAVETMQPINLTDSDVNEVQMTLNQCISVT
jgi:hypothetical protein